MRSRRSDRGQTVPQLTYTMVSTNAETSAGGEGAWRGMPHLVVFRLSSSIVIGTRGLSRARARLHFPLVKMWWLSVLLQDPCVDGELLRSPLSDGVFAALKAAI